PKLTRLLGRAVVKSLHPSKLLLILPHPIRFILYLLHEILP
ncbi:unnamed protein product, partial [Brugia timori]|uniref:Transposase n=1 Tax=Brugia timori TaxID=42155 RepID=A0A0R3R200_9BILA